MKLFKPWQASAESNVDSLLHDIRGRRIFGTFQPEDKNAAAKILSQSKVMLQLGRVPAGRNHVLCQIQDSLVSGGL